MCSTSGQWTYDILIKYRNSFIVNINHKCVDDISKIKPVMTIDVSIKTCQQSTEYIGRDLWDPSRLIQKYEC